MRATIFFTRGRWSLSAQNSPIEQCVCFVSSRKIDHSLCKNHHNNNNNGLWIWELGLRINHQPGCIARKDYD